MTAGQVLIPFRFVSMVGHFIACLLVFWSKGDNVRAGLPLRYTQAQFEGAEASIVVALSLTMVVFLLELVGFWSGLTTFAHGHNFMHVLFHVAGCITVCVFIIEGSHYLLYWFYFAIFSAVPGILELSRITSVALVRKRW